MRYGQKRCKACAVKMARGFDTDRILAVEAQEMKDDPNNKSGVRAWLEIREQDRREALRTRLQLIVGIAWVLLMMGMIVWVLTA